MAFLLAVSMVVGLTRMAVAADNPPATYTLSIELPAGVNLARVRAEVADLNSRNPVLSDTFHQEAQLYPFSVLPEGRFVVLYGFDGTLSLEGSVLSLRIEPTEAQVAQLSFWQDILTYAASMLAGLVIRVACEGAFGLSTGGSGSVFAASFCAALGASIGTLIYQAVNIFADGKQQDWKRWARAVGLAVVAGLVGVAWEGGLNNWARNDLPKLLRAAGSWAADTGRGLVGWARPAGSLLEQVGESLELNAAAVGEGIAEGLEEGAATAATNLRVLPLGDSITYGEGTPDFSGYRARLAALLDPEVDDLDFVGSQQSGQLADRDNEGHQGWTISQISAITSCTVRQYRPNVVTLHIGTNDMARNLNVDTAPNRLRDVIGKILAAAPETTILVSTLIPSTTPSIMSRIQQYNAAIPGVVAGFQAAGRPVYLVDMSAVGTADMTNSLHPNANGFRKMGDAFYKTIDSALRYRAFHKPQDGVSGACGAGTPSPVPGGASAGTSMDGWRNADMIAAGVAGATRAELRFADIDGDGRDDYLLVSPEGRVRAWLNNLPSPRWIEAGEVAAGVPGGTREELRFADLNGDGRDDYLLVSPEGRVRAWLNAYPSKRWTELGEVAAGVTGGTREGLRFADIDGDGRDDYLMVDSQGQVRAWLNNLPSKRWVEWGVVASGFGAALDQVRFADINGDSRDDYLAVDAQGKARAWLSTIGQTGGESWLPQGEIAAGVGVSRDNVEFADVDGDGSADYLATNATAQVWAWLGERFAGTERWNYQGMIAAGVPNGTLGELRFADMDGDGRDDYLMVSPEGRVRAWLNNLPSPRWIEWNEVAAGVPGGTREELRFADLNGDGRDDYLLVSPEGRVRAWLNNLPSRTWTELGEVAAGVPGGTRENLRFADIDGDRRDDYLMIGAQGQVRGWLNALPSKRWTELGEIASGIGLHDSMITFADIDGDGRDDYLSVSDRGRIRAWHNNRGGSGPNWLIQGEIMTGTGATRDQVFLADINGDHRFDYLVSTATGVVTAWEGNGQLRKG
ncbi:FG-GAP-like repeat-containing protein [Parafrankia sp. EUN1f]|uniref:FG-GAP-like repeat-containing protein n=1 Tax=Parafrankia sp. EUN1f TaxID=102897 RepID=UPI001E46A370|nr:FG-GAP-like repeat-containing protein [Parafrankia sp. EUN1f]